MAYLLISAFIDEASPDASVARQQFQQHIANLSGAFLNANTAAVPSPNNAAFNQALVDLVSLNSAFGGAFSASAVSVPSGNFSFVTDLVANPAAVAVVMGRASVGA